MSEVHRGQEQCCQVSLTPNEQRLLRQVTFSYEDLIGNYERYRRNGDSVSALMKSLLARKGIPEHRWLYFTDPKLNPHGRGTRSKLNNFERNGTHGEDVFRHVHFLPFLRFFLFGPHLPPGVISSFRERVVECGMVTSGDLEPLRKHARSLVRAFRLNSSHSDEFYKLALDSGLNCHYADSIRRAVQSVR